VKRLSATRAGAPPVGAVTEIGAQDVPAPSKPTGDVERDLPKGYEVVQLDDKAALVTGASLGGVERAVRIAHQQPRPDRGRLPRPGREVRGLLGDAKGGFTTFLAPQAVSQTGALVSDDDARSSASTGEQRHRRRVIVTHSGGLRGLDRHLPRGARG
jgi:hypothetical protein